MHSVMAVLCMRMLRLHGLGAHVVIKGAWFQQYWLPRIHMQSCEI